MTIQAGAAKDAQEAAMETLRKYNEFLKQRHGYQLPPQEFYPINIEEIIRSVFEWNVVLVPFIFGERVKARCNFKKSEIQLGMDVGTEQQKRFTLAHELAHIVLHSDDKHGCSPDVFRADIHSARIISAQPVNRWTEREADQFAATLLMPPRAVEREFKERFGMTRIWAQSKRVRDIQKEIAAKQHRFWRDSKNLLDAAEALAQFQSETYPVSLAAFFGVSIHAFAIRLLELDMIY
jgi:Zn-dependent peptidase ImmA (M78 family)